MLGYMAIPFNQGALDKLNSERDALQGKLSSSPSAYAGDTAPSGADVSNDLKLTNLKNTIRTMQGQKLKEDWYGKESATASDAPDINGETNKGFLSRVITDLQKPLYGVVGATESLVGKGVKGDLVSNVKDNMSTGHRTFGDLIKKTGAPGWVSAPLGFAADMLFDPVNIATLGTESLVGKVGAGLIRGTAREGLAGGLEAAGKGFTSGLGKDLMNVAEYIPRIPFTPTKLSKTEAFAKASEKIWNQAERYNYLTGVTDPLDTLGKGILGGDAKTGVTLGNYVQDVIEKLPGGPEFVEKFKYDPYKYMQLVKLKDKVLKLTAKTDDLSTISADTGKLLENTSGFVPKAGTSPEISALEKTLADGLDDSVHIAEQGTDSAIHADTMADFEARMIAEGESEGIAKADIQKFVRMNSKKTGIEWYDSVSKQAADKMKEFKVKDVEVGKKLLDGIDFAMKFFKTAKVPMNVASHTNAIVGNVVMDAMAGWDVSKSVPFVTKAYNFLSGKSNAQFILENFMQEASDFSKFVAANPNAFKGTYGFNPTMVGGKYFLDSLIQDGRATGLITAKNEQEVLDSISRMPGEIRKALEDAAEGQGAAKGSLTKSIKEMLDSKGEFRLDTPTEMVENYTKEGVPSMAGDPSSAIRDLDLKGGVYMDFIKKKAAEGNVGFKLLDAAMEKATSIFERHDQASKLGKALYATKEGLTLEELKKLSRMVPEGITRGDVVGESVVSGQKRYRLTWDKATDLVNETNMNYSAMPAFVRMMRSMPIIGSPFVSFTYAAIPKTAKTLMHNPAAFNNINFLLNEFSGDKTPVEKENLKSKYSQWFKSPGLFRVPFTDAHPAYVNIANMLPYYSLSLWNPSQREYKDALPSTLVQAIDKLQLFKDPAGQVMFDYFVLPHLLSEQERPTSQFGQPLYPISATGLDKAGYAARSLGEAFVPGVASVAGLVGGKVAPGATPFVPSYGYRKLANAVQQNNSLGIPSKDSAANLTVKGLAGLAGLQYNNMDLTYLQNKSKKK